ncbi:glycosyltransferase family 2 protein [Pantoea ananatis]|uniref:glycosyltransferase family 2 protein n=1 Tax=Pantoea ananas TaxID=553 RepID=UPI0004266D15|nr:glycosyltransferase family 2 protein [Pantoea ananatis]MCH9267954.1 glycosyltransferase family 2 protein [Pantoea ananatis]REF09995.1 glycosyltransferase involved in cell wall biosynthesis [Pantoea ananatis]
MKDITILMPCLNEAETLHICITKALNWVKSRNLNAEILISDNGSTDGSQEIAKSLGARVVDAPLKGYGAALQFGIENAESEYIVMGDSDDSYDFSRLDMFYDKLHEGYDLVMGNRFAGGIDKGAMPWKNRYIGNPILSTIGKLLFKCESNDFHCGLRGFTKTAYMKMDLRTTGMEFASEMVIKANLLKLKIIEVPTTLSVDGRSRPPHLRPWRDGWRHLRFMMLFSPQWLFIIPGLVLMGLSLLVYLTLYSSEITIGSITFGSNTLIYASLGVALGLLSVFFGLFTGIFGAREGLLPATHLSKFIARNSVLEYGCIAAIILVLLGFYFGVDTVAIWAKHDFGSLDYVNVLKKVSLACMLILNGGVLFFSSLMLGFLSLPLRKKTD